MGDEIELQWWTDPEELRQELAEALPDSRITVRWAAVGEGPAGSLLYRIYGPGGSYAAGGVENSYLGHLFAERLADQYREATALG